MDKRFRRESNLRPSAKKNDKLKQHVSDASKKDKKEISFSEYFLEMYKKTKKNHVIRDTFLLTGVLLCVLFVVSTTLPKIFSFHLDTKSILSFFDSTPQTQINEGEESGDLDILILGRGGRGNSAPDLTDSIIAAHYNKSENSFTTLSIPRDLFVQSDELWRVKINELYSGWKSFLWEEGAMNHLMETVSVITGRDIRMYALIDFSWFKKLIDTLGGVDIEVPERLYDPEYPDSNWWYTIVNIPEGLQHFDGDKALKYVRSRHTTSDFDRSRRQQLLIQALREKMLSMELLTSPTKIQSIYTVINDSVQTNISLKDMYKMAKIASKIEKQNMHNYALDTSCFNSLKLCEPGWLIYSPGRELYGGMSVLLPKKVSTNSADTYETIRLFSSIITQYPQIWSSDWIAVVNASGKTNLALTVALKLKSIGIPVDAESIKNQTEKVETSFIRYNAATITPDHPLLNAIKLTFWGEIRAAKPEELTSMSWPYELVLGKDASLYFQ